MNIDIGLVAMICCLRMAAAASPCLNSGQVNQKQESGETTDTVPLFYRALMASVVYVRTGLRAITVNMNRRHWRVADVILCSWWRRAKSWATMSVWYS